MFKKPTFELKFMDYKKLKNKGLKINLKECYKCYNILNFKKYLNNS
jgi:hypothetical protein